MPDHEYLEFRVLAQPLPGEPLNFDTGLLGFRWIAELVRGVEFFHGIDRLQRDSIITGQPAARI
jgi:hypothetical protein